jgi:hypothetical protein
MKSQLFNRSCQESIFIEICSDGTLATACQLLTFAVIIGNSFIRAVTNMRGRYVDCFYQQAMDLHYQLCCL